MAVTRLSSQAAVAMAQALADQVDAGTAGASALVIYNGTMPADVDTPIDTQTELVNIALPVPAFQAAVESDTGGTITISDDVTSANPVASGTATFGRFYDRDQNAVLDVDVTIASGTGALKLSSVTVVLGVPVTVVALNISQRKA